MGDSGKNNKGQAIRQIILVVVMLLFLGGFLLDKFVLWPSHMEKIDKIVNQVTLKLSPENRQQVHEIVGGGPNSTFTHNGIEVEQYRFARGIPGFKRPMLDIAYVGDTIAFFRQDGPIDAAYIDQQRDAATVDDSKGDLHPGEGQIMGPGGRARPQQEKKDEDSSDADDTADDETATESDDES